MASNEEIRIVDVPERDRFELYVGSQLAGFTDYHSQPGLITLLYTEIEPAFEGEGLGSRFAAGMLDEIRDRGERILPICPFVRSFLQRRPHYADLVAIS